MALEYGSDAWEEAYREILSRRLRRASRPYVTGTPEWVEAYERAVQGDDEYRELAADWEGTVVLHTLSDPEMGVQWDLYILMDLWHGECRKMRIVPPQAGEDGDYVITGTPLTWIRLGRGELDTNKAVMQGKLMLKGNLSNLVRYSQAAVRLGKISARVGGRSIDDLDPGEAEELKVIEGEFVDRLIGKNGRSD